MNIFCLDTRVVIGFTQPSYTVTEGGSAHVCIKMSSGKLGQTVVFTLGKDLSFSSCESAGHTAIVT